MAQFILRILVLSLSLLNLPTFAQSSPQNADGLYPSAASLQKELFETIMSETHEFTQEYIRLGQYYKNSSTPQYQKMVQELCDKKNMQVCPEVYFTTHDIVGARMQPNGMLEVKEKDMKGMSDTQIKFYLYHEVGHFFLQHTLKRTFAIAMSIQDNNIMVIDPERILPVAGFLPGMREARQRFETEADQFAYHELGIEASQFDCTKSMAQLLKGQTASTQEHLAINERCALLH